MMQADFVGPAFALISSSLRRTLQRLVHQAAFNGKNLKNANRQSIYQATDTAVTASIHNKKYKPDFLGLIFFSRNLPKK